MGELDVIDRAVFNAVLASVGDLEFLRELIEGYFEDSPTLLAALHTALAAGNAGEFRRAAHSLKSTSASLGATNLATLCRELEEMGRAGALDGAAAAIGRAEAEYARVRVALDLAITA